MERAVKLDNLAWFLRDMQRNGFSAEAIVRQLEIFMMGNRDVELHDSAIVLIDGEVEV